MEGKRQGTLISIGSKSDKGNRVIAIDTNASPIHLAIAEVSKTGELLSYQTISLHHLLGLSQNSKDHQERILAHRIVDLAIEKGKAIAVECLTSSKGSPPLPYSWKGLAKRSFSSEASVGGRGVG